MKTIEEKIYEALGVILFKKFVIWIQYIIFKPLKIDINKRFQFGSNYFISGGSVKELKRFRFGLLFNTLIHSWSLYGCLALIIGGITGVGLLIYIIICTLINVYCLMLQRYNNIRLERTIKAKKEHIKLMEERKKQKVVEDILIESKNLPQKFSLANLHESQNKHLTTLRDEDIRYTGPYEEIEQEHPIKMEMKRK